MNFRDEDDDDDDVDAREGAREGGTPPSAASSSSLECLTAVASACRPVVGSSDTPHQARPLARPTPHRKWIFRPLSLRLWSSTVCQSCFGHLETVLILPAGRTNLQPNAASMQT